MNEGKCGLVMICLGACTVILQMLAGAQLMTGGPNTAFGLIVLSLMFFNMIGGIQMAIRFDKPTWYIIGMIWLVNLAVTSTWI